MSKKINHKKLNSKQKHPFAIVVSQFNKNVTDGLLFGARSYLEKQGVKSEKIKVYEAPGAFEIPLLSQELAKSKRFAGIICLGAVIKGETAHFEHISSCSSMGLMRTMLKTRIPITFGILTAYTEEQALLRSGKKPKTLPNNKGQEAASACFKMVKTLEELQ